jgi:hypothetical protein
MFPTSLLVNNTVELMVRSFYRSDLLLPLPSWHSPDSNYNDTCLIGAPYYDNFNYGLELIFQYIRHRQALYIERGTLLQAQLGSIPRGILGEHPESEYYAVNVLRYALASFEKFRAPKMTEEVLQELYEQIRFIPKPHLFLSVRKNQNRRAL